MMKSNKCQYISQAKYKKMKDYRREAGLSQIELARLMGMNRQQTISDWENGKYFPDDENIKKMAKIFKVSPSKLEHDLRVWFTVRQLKKLQIPKEDLLCMMS